MKTLAIEDIATVFASEFVKQTSVKNDNIKDTRIMFQDFLKMNFARRKKVVEKVLNKMSV